MGLVTKSINLFVFVLTGVSVKDLVAAGYPVIARAAGGGSIPRVWPRLMCRLTRCQVGQWRLSWGRRKESCDSAGRFFEIWRAVNAVVARAVEADLRYFHGIVPARRNSESASGVLKFGRFGKVGRIGRVVWFGDDCRGVQPADRTFFDIACDVYGKVDGNFSIGAEDADKLWCQRPISVSVGATALLESLCNGR